MFLREVENKVKEGRGRGCGQWREVVARADGLALGLESRPLLLTPGLRTCPGMEPAGPEADSAALPAPPGPPLAQLSGAPHPQAG